MTQEELNSTFLCFQQCQIRLRDSPTVNVEVCDIDGVVHNVTIPLQKVSKDIYITTTQLNIPF